MSNNEMDLVAGYDTYTHTEELDITNDTDAPGTSPVCASAIVSYTVADTINDGC